jgi:hypothetical protein
MQSITAAGTVRTGTPDSSRATLPSTPTPIDGRRRRPRRSAPKAPPQQREKCGSRRGWLAHQYYHEDPCEGCATAHADYHREYYRTHYAKGA